MSEPTRAVKCMLKRFRKHYSKASVHSWSFPYEEMQCEVRVVTEAYWEGRLDLCWWLFAGDVFFDTAACDAVYHGKSEYTSTKDVAHALEIRNDFECNTTLRMKGKTDVTAGRATSARRGVGRAHHLDARL